ncbi:MAG: DUF2842 domain-containing protein [Sphingomonadaceae bacterium]|nr:DUF2842 domain-containing protein [Sphingomonadaceae bacterium]
MNPNQPRPSWRKPAGMIAILAIIALWAFIVVSASGFIGQLPIIVQGVIYLVAGIVWIAPLRPLLIWMETGSFSAPTDARKFRQWRE